MSVTDKPTGADWSPTLTEFLLARIAEDEAAVDQSNQEHYLIDKDGVVLRDEAGVVIHQCAAVVDGEYVTVDCPHPRPLGAEERRALADCEAKRRIVEMSAHYARWDDDTVGDHSRGVLELLTLPYVDHADYREEWKP